MAWSEYYFTVKATKYFGPSSLASGKLLRCHEAFKVAVVRVHYGVEAVGVSLKVVAPFFECGNDG